MDINQSVQNQQNQEPQNTSKPACRGCGKKCWIIGIIVFLVIVLGVVLALTVFKTTPKAPPQQQAQSPQTQNAPASSFDQPAQTPKLPLEEDSTAAISQQLDNVIVTDLDSQFKDIDADLNQL